MGRRIQYNPPRLRFLALRAAADAVADEDVAEDALETLPKTLAKEVRAGADNRKNFKTVVEREKGIEAKLMV